MRIEGRVRRLGEPGRWASAQTAQAQPRVGTPNGGAGAEEGEGRLHEWSWVADGWSGRGKGPQILFGNDNRKRDGGADASKAGTQIPFGNDNRRRAGFRGALSRIFFAQRCVS